MAENLLRETWANLDSHELRLVLDERIGGPGQHDDRDPTQASFIFRSHAHPAASRSRFEIKRSLL